LSREKRFALLKKEKQSLKDRKKKKAIPSVNRGRESTFWKNIKAITPNIFWTRIETYGTPGLPDLLGVYMHEPRNISFWCELKIAKGNQLLLSPFQISWNVKRFSLCQDNFIMAKIPETREICLWSGSLVRELAVNYTEVEPLFVVKQPYKDALEPALKSVLVRDLKI
jgi:hypothetical protein